MPPSLSPLSEIETLAKPSPLVHRLLGEPRFHTEGDVAAISFAPDGSLYSIDETGVLRNWTVDGHCRNRQYLSDLETLWSFSPGAKILASGNDDLVLWDVSTGTLLKRISSSSWVTALAFSWDGKLLASGHDDGKVRIWDTTTHALVSEFIAHPQPVSAIAFSPDNQHLATAGEDRAIRIFDRSTGTKLHELLSHTDRIPALAWNADGSLLISAGWDTAARVWKLGETDPVMLLNSHSDQVVSLALSPTSGLLASADSDHDVYVWSNVSDGKALHVLRGHVDEVRSLAFNQDGSLLATAGADRVVQLWNTKTGQRVAGHNPAAKHEVAIVPNSAGKLQLASTAGGQLRVWDVETAKPTIHSTEQPANCVAASSNGRWLAIGGTDHFTHLIDLTEGTATRKLEATKPPIGSLAFSRDGNFLVQSSPKDGLVWLWNTTTANPDLILIEAADGCTLESLAFHPDGQHVIVGGLDYLSTEDRTGAVCVWDLTTKKKSAVFDIGVFSVAIDHAGRFVAGAGVNEAVFLWDLETQEQVFELTGHQGKVNCVTFSPDGSYLLSCGDDLTVRVWDVLSGRLVIIREFDTAIHSLAFSPDGAWLFTGNANTTCYQLEFRKFLQD